MKFCDKLQKIRKGNNISQEQLADKLGVSRQAVSKWESGQSYPEMDKLLSICKIFNVSLDYLTNDKIADVEENKNDGKNVINTFVDQVVNFINRFINMVTHIDCKTLLMCAFETLILIMIIILFKKPFDYIDYLIGNVLRCLPSTIYHILDNTIYLIIMIAYIMLSVLIMFYYFDKRWLCRYEHNELNVKDNASSDGDQEVKNNQNSSIQLNGSHISRILSILGNIIVFCFKLFILFISIPVCIFFMFIVLGIVLNIYAIFKGVLYFGPLLCMIACGLFIYIILKIVYSILFNIKNNLKVDFLIIILCFILGGFGGGVTTVEIMHTKIQNSPAEQSMIEDTYNYKMSNNLLINNNGNSALEYKVDETLNDNVKVLIKYNPTLIIVNEYKKDNQINFSYDMDQFNLRMNYFNLILDDLKDKVINDYSDLTTYTITIVSSSKNIDILQKNYNQYWNSNNTVESDDVNDKVDSLNETIDNLQISNDKLREENEKLKDKLSTYDSTLKDLLDN